MHHRGNVVTANRFAHRGSIGDVALHQIAELDGGPVAGDEVVEHHDSIAGPLQCFRGVAADIARAAGDQNRARTNGQWKNS